MAELTHISTLCFLGGWSMIQVPFSLIYFCQFFGKASALLLTHLRGLGLGSPPSLLNHRPAVNFFGQSMPTVSDLIFSGGVVHLDNFHRFEIASHKNSLFPRLNYSAISSHASLYDIPIKVQLKRFIWNSLRPGAFIPLQSAQQWVGVHLAIVLSRRSLLISHAFSCPFPSILIMDWLAGGVQH